MKALRIAASSTVVFAFIGAASPGLVSFAAPTSHGGTPHSLARRVAALEARAACTHVVAPVSQFGRDAQPLEPGAAGYYWLDSSGEDLKALVTSALDLDTESEVPTMYLVTVSPKCVKRGTSFALLPRSSEGGGLR
jgi:hypothetical protein